MTKTFRFHQLSFIVTRNGRGCYTVQVESSRNEFSFLSNNSIAWDNLDGEDIHAERDAMRSLYNEYKTKSRV